MALRAARDPSSSTSTSTIVAEVSQTHPTEVSALISAVRRVRSGPARVRFARFR
jgi:hypothetical protein